jgi:hypothetical protein
VKRLPARVLTPRAYYNRRKRGWHTVDQQLSAEIRDLLIECEFHLRIISGMPTAQRHLADLIHAHMRVTERLAASLERQREEEDILSVT